MKSYLNLLVVATFLILNIVSCTKQRPLKFLDSDLRDGLVKKEWVNGSVYDIQTTDEASSPIFEKDKDWLAVNHQTSYKVDGSLIPKQLKFMFKDLYIPAQPETDYKILLEADRMGVTAYLLIDSLKSLPLVQQQLALSHDSELGSFKVPLFYYTVKNYGKPVANKNELEEKTNSARLQSTDWNVATYLSLDYTSTDRKPIGLVGNAQRDWERVFLADQMLDVVVKASDLRKYRISTSIEDDKNVVLKAQGDEIVVFEVTNTSSNLLSETDVELIRSGKESERVRKCSDVENLKDSGQCVLVGRFKVPVSRIEADRNIVDRGGEKGDVVVFRVDQSRSDFGLIRIAEDPTPVDFNPDEAWDPRYYFKTADLMNRKFYLRRTIQDIPRQVPLYFIGEGGPLMLVQFIKKENQILVQKTEQAINFSNPSSSDVETVMSFNAEYFRSEEKDSSGRKLKIPRLVKTTANDSASNVVIKLDWKNPIVYKSGSPLGSIEGKGACFTSANDAQMEALDNRLSSADRGVLSFTLSATYFPNPSLVPYCFGSQPGIAAWATGWGGLEVNFNIKERVSFYEHKPVDENFKSLDIPYEAQKALGAGFIGRPKSLPTKAGITGFQDNISENLLLHDFKKGQKETWYLVGLPTNYEFKNEIIETTHKVFDDLNKKFRLAFKGTPKETIDDLFEVRIVGVDTNENVVIGDQDKNIIIYEARPTENGYLGVYQGSGSPTTGKYTNGNVVIFGGNTVSNIEYLRWASSIRKKYRQTYNEVVASFAKENNIPLAQSSKTGQQKSGGLSDFLNNMFPLGQEVKTPAESSPKDYFAPLKPNYNLVDGLKENLPQLNNSNYGLGFQKTGDLASIKTLSELIDLGKAANEFKIASPQGKLNISKLFDDALANGQLTQEQYNYALLQRVYDKVISKNGPEVFLTQPKIVEAALYAEFIENPPFEVSNQQLEELQAAHAKLSFENAKVQMYKSSSTPYCFHEAPALDDFIFDNMNTSEIFKNFYANTLEHELLHNFGLEHQFEGSYDGKNFEFEGEKVGRLTSGLMEYGTLEERSTWRGMGPHDVHAIRLAYTGMVEIESAFAWAIKKETPGYIKVGFNNGQIEKKIPVSQDKLISIYDLKNVIFSRVDWNEFSEDLIRNSGVKLRAFEYCTNRDLGIDPTCMMHDKGTTVPEIVANMANDHWQSYWISNFENDRYRYGIMNVIRNMYSSYSRFHQMRSYTDALLARVFLQGRGRSFHEPKSYDDSLNLELFKASIFTRDYLLSFIKTPEPQGYVRGINAKSLVPFKLEAETNDGKKVPIVGVVESRSAYSSTSSVDRYATIGNYLDKMAAIESLTQKMSSRAGLLNNDLAVPSQFSYIELEKYLMGISNPLESPILNLLKEFIMDDVGSMVLVGPERNFPLDIGSEFGKVEIPNALSFTASKAAILNTYSNALLEEYNFSNLFRVYSVRGKMPSGMSNVKSMVDLSYDQDTNSQRRYFADGGSNSMISNAIISHSFIYRTLLDGKSKLSLDLNKYIQYLVEDKSSADLNSENEIKRNKALYNVEKAKQLKAQLIEDMKGELGFSEDLAIAFVEPLSQASTFVPAIFQGVADGIKNKDNSAIGIWVKEAQSLADANPFAFSGIASLIESHKEKESKELLGLPTDIAEQLFTKDAFKMKYSSVKANLDMMNVFFSMIDPSARNR
jgi:hypothetical protein